MSSQDERYEQPSRGPSAMSSKKNNTHVKSNSANNTANRSTTWKSKGRGDQDWIQNAPYPARVCDAINDSLDVEGLCRAFLPRIEKLVANQGGRLAE